MVEGLQAFVGYVMKWKETEGRGSSWARVSPGMREEGLPHL